MTESDVIEKVLISPVWPECFHETINNDGTIDYHEMAKVHELQDQILEFFLIRMVK